MLVQLGERERDDEQRSAHCCERGGGKRGVGDEVEAWEPDDEIDCPSDSAEEVNYRRGKKQLGGGLLEDLTFADPSEQPRAACIR